MSIYDRPCPKCGATDRYDSGGCRPCTIARTKAYDAAHPQAAARRKSVHDKRQRNTLPFGLTERQHRVMQAMSNCGGDRELVADEMRRRVTKIDYYLRDIFRRMCVSSDAEAMRMWEQANPTGAPLQGVSVFSLAGRTA